MKVTKYEHACVVVEEQGKRLVIDPGIYAASFVDYSNVAAIVITHSHQDHFDPAKVEAIVRANPAAQIFTTRAVSDQLSLKTLAAHPGESKQAEPFNLTFTGGKHAFIYDQTPQEDNVGVLVNGILYYPGDSFAQPHGLIKVLALPANAPWMKLSEAIEFLRGIKPQLAFPTHNVFLSEDGTQLVNRLLGGIAQETNTDYRPLGVGDSLDAS